MSRSTHGAGNLALGVLLVVTAAVLWGTTGTAQAFSSGATSPAWIGALRLTVAAVFFWTMVAGRRVLGAVRSGDVAGAARDETGFRAGMLVAGLAMTSYNLCFFVGVKSLGVGVGTALTIGSGPLWAGLLEWVLWRRAPSVPWWVGTGLSVAGAVLLLNGDGGPERVSPAGVAACLGAGLSYAVFALSNKRLVTGADPLAVTTRVFSVAAVAALPLALLFAGPLTMPRSDIPVVLHLGVVATGVAYWLFSAGQRHVGGATTVTLALAEPLTAFLLAVLLLAEPVGVVSVAGIVLLVGGLTLVVRTESGD